MTLLTDNAFLQTKQQQKMYLILEVAQFNSCISVKFEWPSLSAIISEVSLPPNKSLALSPSVGSC